MMELKCPELNEEHKGKIQGERVNDVDKEYCDSFLNGEGCIYRNECPTYQKFISGRNSQ